MRFSVVIPVLNEAAQLEHALQALLETIPRLSDTEIIVCDGGSNDATAGIARQFPVILKTCPQGRASQMNCGAQSALGDWLIFLHADTRLPANWQSLINNLNKDWGRFDLRLSSSRKIFRIIESLINLRSRLTLVATGDQGMFFRREFFEQLNGFPDIPLMEDIAISKRARALQPAALLKQKVITSSRRWEQRGVIRTILLMWWLRFGYWIGIKPQTLHRWYYPKLTRPKKFHG